MLGVGLCSSLDQKLMGTGSWVNIEEGRRETSAYGVMMNVRSLVMLCESIESAIE